MERRKFIQNTGILGAAMLVNKWSVASAFSSDFPVVRVPLEKRHFKSQVIEDAIIEFKSKTKNKELGWLFENCFPNTIDTTVTYSTKNGRPDTYVITGDIDAMWLRDSSAQVWPYLQFATKEKSLQQMIAGLVNRQTQCILKDPYANAFYNDPNKKGEWFSDETDMKAGVHERKWEIDSLCYPIRLAYNYWKTTGDTSVFDSDWKQAVATILKTFKEQQRKDSLGPYKFQRKTTAPTDSLPMSGYGLPVNPVGLICSSFRPSDDATVFSFLVPSNFFAVVSLREAAEIITKVYSDSALAAQLTALASEVEQALKKYAIVNHPKYGKVYAFEVDGFGNQYLMDDANIPSLMALPYLNAIKNTDPIYVNTKKMLWSTDNPFYFKGTAAEGIGGPHIGHDMIWPLSIITRGLTSNNDAEIKKCIDALVKTHGGTGFMHESFHKDNPAKFTRAWFAWTNTIFGEFVWKTYKTRPHLI